IPLAKSVADALTLSGKELAVDGVLLLASEGPYKPLPSGQMEDPNDGLFKQIVEVFHTKGKSLPVFVDGKLSWSFEKAKQIYDQSKKDRFALMAGSSLPVTWRKPAFDLRFGTKLDSALVIAGGPAESNGFHALEALQSLVER